MNKINSIILCGGSGTRLWPLSRTEYPKQFLVLDQERSLFQNTVHRLKALQQLHFTAQKSASYTVVCNEAHRFLTKEQLREMHLPGNCHIILEAYAKNTASALTLAALHAIEQNSASADEAILVVTPADAAISNQDNYLSALNAAIKVAEQGNIVILGVKPTSPECGYGYIKVNSNTSATVDNAQLVENFVEKPNQQLAEQYLAAGNYYWNAGIFVLKASVWLAALEHFRPDIYSACLATWQTKQVDDTFIRFDQQLFAQIPAQSIDYAVMEHCPGSQFPLQMLALDAGWSDLGAWDAVWENLRKDEQGNVASGDVMLQDCKNSMVHSSSRVVGVIGLENVVVIETADAVLVADKQQSQNVKQLVNKLSAQGRQEHNLHRKVHRPWGWYDSIDSGERFQVKRIQVAAKSTLSLQKHYHRAEHWIVVKGTAEVTCGERVFLLEENQSTYIPLGEIHRLRNPGSIPLEIIEVQSGSYLGEDDIVRYEDLYGRNN